MLSKLKMFLIAAVLIGAAVLLPKMTAQAETLQPKIYQALESRSEKEDGTITATVIPTFIRDIADGVGVNGSSGVTELDNAAQRTNTLINWICGWVGGIMALFGFIWAAMNQAGHNTESRNMGIIVAVVGIIIAFAPKIVNFILG